MENVTGIQLVRWLADFGFWFPCWLRFDYMQSFNALRRKRVVLWSRLCSRLRGGLCILLRGVLPHGLYAVIRGVCIVV